MRLINETTGFFLNDMLKGYSVGKYFREFKSHLSLSREEIESIQHNKLISLLKHAYENTPFYRNRLDAIGASPQDFHEKRLISQIAPLTRNDLQNHWQEIVSKKHDPKKLKKGSSSGSTGTPVFYFKDNNATSAGQAAGYLGWSFAGWRLGMKGLHIWGNPTTVKNEWGRTSSKLKAMLLRHNKFPAYQLTNPVKLRELADHMIVEKFDFIDGYTNSIYIVAEWIRKNRGSLPEPLKMVLTTAENLHKYQRDVIGQALGPVFDLYACSEINGISAECSICGQYHVIDTHVLIEYGKIVDEFQNRELIITDLDNHAFPLIRYLNNDNGKPSEGSLDCSIPFSRMKQVSGRQSDIITLPGGGTLSVPSFFGSMLLKKVKGIVKYQIEKDRPDHLLIKFVTNSEFQELDIEIIKDSMHTYLADKILWDITIVEDIPVSQSGKFKLVIDKTKI
jgi:phenylacetate-CoA ligase